MGVSSLLSRFNPLSTDTTIDTDMNVLILSQPMPMKGQMSQDVVRKKDAEKKGEGRIRGGICPGQS